MITFLVRVKFNNELPDGENGNYSAEKLGKIISFQLKKNGAFSNELKVLIAGGQLVIETADKDKQLVDALLAYIIQKANLAEEPKEITASETEEILKQDNQKADKSGRDNKIRDQLESEITEGYAIFPPEGDKRAFSEIEEVYFGVVRRLRAKFPQDNIYISGEGGRKAVFCIIPQERVRAFEKEVGREKQNHGLEIRRLNV